MSNRELFRFLLIAFGLALVTQLLAIRAGISGTSPWLLLTMWCPGLAALVTSRRVRASAFTAIKRIAWKWIPAGILVGCAPTLVANAWLAVTRTGHWNDEQFRRMPDGRISMVKIANFVADLPLTPPLFVLNLVGTLALAAVIGGVFAGVGEELGWRSILQPELERRFGRTRGVLLVGVLWAYWHLPVNLAGHNDAAHPIANALLFFPLGVIAMAFSFGWLARSSRSVWPAAVAHSANNAIASAFLMKENSWGAGLIASLIGYAIVGLVFALVTCRPSTSSAARSVRSGSGSPPPIGAGHAA